ncbi:MAG: acetate--CoA ligase family protein [Pseudomonadota bacterium]
MLTRTMEAAIETGRKRGWVLEPVAKQILREAGFQVPESVLVTDAEEALAFAASVGFPLVAKAVSPEILHKTEYKAVVTSIQDREGLVSAVERLKTLPGTEAVLVEAMIQGVELILGAKNDYQFGPVILLGTGGTGVELYNDVAVRMAPVKNQDVVSMVESLKGKALIKGFRGAPGVNLSALSDMVVRFSQFAMAVDTLIDSMDLNPVICTPDRCVVADARLMTPMLNR